MAGDDKQTRPTRPPAASHEDPPPLQRGPVPPRVLPETIAQMATRAPQKSVLTEHEELLRAVAQISEEQRTREAAFRAEIHDLVVEHHLPPDPKLPTIELPPPEKKRFSLAPKSIRDMSWMSHVPAILMAIAALVTTVTQSCVKKQELSDDALAKIKSINDALDAHVKAHDIADVSAATKKQLEYKYGLDQRSWLASVLEKLSVKVDDPPDAPKRETIEFYPSPLVGSKAPRIQPKATFPAPPAP